MGIYLLQILLCKASLLILIQKVNIPQNYPLVATFDANQKIFVVKALQMSLYFIFLHFIYLIRCFTFITSSIPKTCWPTLSNKTAVTEPVLSENYNLQLNLYAKLVLPHYWHSEAFFSTFFLHSQQRRYIMFKFLQPVRYTLNNEINTSACVVWSCQGHSGTIFITALRFKALLIQYLQEKRH